MEQHPPIKTAYAGKKSAPAPRRDLSGVWDAAEADGGRQPSGAFEHAALMAPRDKASKGDNPTRRESCILSITRPKGLQRSSQ